MSEQTQAASAIRVLHYSPHGENDGIAKYQEQYLRGMEQIPGLENSFFHVSPLRFRHLPDSERKKVLQQLREELVNFDILHVQHEFGLFGDTDFGDIVAIAKESGKKIVVSVHLSPGFAIQSVHLGGAGPRSIIHYLRQRRYRNKLLQRHITPMLGADRLLVHNTVTADALQEMGINPAKITKIVHPVYDFPKPAVTSVIAGELHKQPGDVIYCTVGMMHRYKGIYDAVKALKYLPENYKLAIMGGVHPLSEDMPMYNKVADLIVKLGLRDRVYIAGFVKDDDLFNSYIQECDISIFPYDGYYYGHLSSGSINLALANSMPVIAYPTSGFKELAESADGAIVVTETFSYYELARELRHINIERQRGLSQAYASKMAWPKMAQTLAQEYKTIMSKA